MAKKAKIAKYQKQQQLIQQYATLRQELKEKKITQHYESYLKMLIQSAVKTEII